MLTEFTLPWKNQPFSMLGGYALGVGGLVFMVEEGDACEEAEGGVFPRVAFVHKFQESRRCLVLHVDGNRHYILDKSSFSPEELHGVRELFRTTLPEN